MNKLKIAYFVHGRGRGHATRAHSVLQKLIFRKYTVTVFAGRDAYKALGESNQIELINSVFPESSWRVFVSRLIHDYRTLKKLKVDCVISDGDAPSVWAAKLLGIHVISIGHAMIFPYCKHPIRTNRWQHLKENLKVRIATQWSDYKIIVHFCTLKLKIRKGVVVKPDGGNEEGNNNHGHVVSYFRDGNGEKLLGKLVKSGQEVINFGKPVAIKGVYNRLLNQAEFKEVLLHANGVAGSAGSNLIFESMAWNKPMFLIYDAAEFEQKANADYVEFLEVGEACPVDALDVGKLDSFAARLKQPYIKKHSDDIMPVLSDALLSHLTLKFG